MSTLPLARSPASACSGPGFSGMLGSWEFLSISNPVYRGQGVEARRVTDDERRGVRGGSSLLPLLLSLSLSFAIDLLFCCAEGS